MKSSGKIIIRPRPATRNAATRASPEAESDPQLPLVKEENETEGDQIDDDDDDEDDDENNDGNSNDGNDDSQNKPGEDDDAADGTSAAADDQEMDAEGDAPTKRGRGRPKGSGMKSSGTSTPRGRASKARGRPKGRPKTASGGQGLTIRLKALKGEGEEVSEDEYTPEAEAVPVAAVEATAEAESKEAPMGGGKPFRKIAEKVYVIDGDEFKTDDDPKGNEKIDIWGNLLGGRKFKASTFILPNRHPQRQYLLAIDAARTSGFRDSLYYFRRNPLAFKLNATQPEKDYLIAEGKLGSHLRTRSVTLVTARSAFKLHGSKMIIDGRWVTDDYYEEKVLAEITAKGLQAGDLVGELPDPNAPAHAQPDPNSLTNTAFANANVAGGGGGIYRAGGATTIFGGSGWGPFSDGPLNAVRKSLLSRDGVTEENWMWMMATRTGEADEEWSRLRKEGRGKAGLAINGVVIGGRGGAWERPDGLTKDSKHGRGVQGLQDEIPATGRKRKSADGDGALGAYEPHSHLVIYRKDTQPTRAKWQPISNSPKRRVLGGTKAGNGAWSMAWVDTLMQLPEEDEEAQAKREEEQREREALVRGTEEILDPTASMISGRGSGAVSRGMSVASTRGVSAGV